MKEFIVAIVILTGFFTAVDYQNETEIVSGFLTDVQTVIK